MSWNHSFNIDVAILDKRYYPVEMLKLYTSGTGLYLIVKSTFPTHTQLKARVFGEHKTTILKYSREERPLPWHLSRLLYGNNNIYRDNSSYLGMMCFNELVDRKPSTRNK